MISRRIRRLLMRQWPHVVRATRATTAALVALAVAVVLRLECPYWGAMTALIVIQPTRGLLLEKSFYRLIGTVVGSTAGMLLVLHFRSPATLTVALALWVAGCVGTGNLLYGFRSYSCLLAGYTCSVISMLGYQNPPDLRSLAFGRIACIMVGIIVATAITALFTPRQSNRLFMKRLQTAAGKTVACVASMVSHGAWDSAIALERDVLVEIADIESLLDTVGAGSLNFKKRKRHVRSLIAALLSVLAAGRLVRGHASRPDAQAPPDSRRQNMALRLDNAADTLMEGGSATACAAQLRAVLMEVAPLFPLLEETLDELVTSLQLALADYDTLETHLEGEQINRFIRHRDWYEAWRAAIRAALAIIAVGGAWYVTGWADTPMMLIGTSIMISLFSTKDHPAAFLKKVFVGVCAGVAVALLCRLVFIPAGTDPFVEMFVIALILWGGVFAMSQPQLSASAVDGTLIFMLVMQPGVATVVAPPHLVPDALALIMGVGIAWCAYRYLLPISPAVRQRSLLIAIARDIQLLARMDSPSDVARLRARSHHRVLRLVALTEGFDADRREAVEGGLAALGIGRCIQHLRQAQKSRDESRADAEVVEKILLTLTGIERRPENVVEVLKRTVTALYGVLGPGKDLSGETRVNMLAADLLCTAAEIAPEMGYCKT